VAERDCDVAEDEDEDDDADGGGGGARGGAGSDTGIALEYAAAAVTGIAKEGNHPIEPIQAGAG